MRIQVMSILQVQTNGKKERGQFQPELRFTRDSAETLHPYDSFFHTD